MKDLFLAFVFLTFVSCSQKNTEPRFYGKEFDTSKAIPVSELADRIHGQDKIEAIVTGKISSSCKAEGCWMNLENTTGEEVYVDWDHQFNIPLKSEGRMAIVSGYAYYDSTGNVKKLAFKATGAWL